MAEEKKKRGRPKGSKDKTKRKTKTRTSEVKKSDKKGHPEKPQTEASQASSIKRRKKNGRPPKGQETTIEQCKAALKAEGGYINLSAARLGISSATLCRRIKNNSELKEFLESMDEEQFRFGMSQLLKHIKSGDLDAIKFYMKGKGHKYDFYPKVSKQELEISNAPGNGNIFRIERRIVNFDDTENTD